MRAISDQRVTGVAVAIRNKGLLEGSHVLSNELEFFEVEDVPDGEPWEGHKEARCLGQFELDGAFRPSAYCCACGLLSPAELAQLAKIGEYIASKF